MCASANSVISKKMMQTEVVCARVNVKRVSFNKCGHFDQKMMQAEVYRARANVTHVSFSKQ